MALGRILEVQIGEADLVNMVAKSEAVVISGLDMSFNIVRSNRPSDNKANFTVYNASKTTRDRFLATGRNIVVYAGYEDEGNKALIYAGNIDSVTTDKTDSDIQIDIKSSTYRGRDTGTEPVNISMAFDNGSNMKEVMLALSDIMGFNLRGGENAAKVMLPNGFHYIGSVNGCFRKCYHILASHQLSITKDNQDMFVFRYGYIYDDGYVIDAAFANQYDDHNKIVFPEKFRPQRTGATLGETSIPVISFNGSLISIEDEVESENVTSLLHKDTATDKKTLKLTTLLDPRYTPNSGVVIDTPNIYGKFVINTVNHYGSNYDDNFFSKLEVQSVD